MKLNSLDPRVNRMDLSDENPYTDQVLHNMEHWETYEVFHQKKRGTQHVHCGIVHAPNADMALLFAKEQFARRGETSNLWVVKTENVMAVDYGDADIFETTPEKVYRDASGYKVMDRINEFKKKQNA